MPSFAVIKDIPRVINHNKAEHNAISDSIVALSK